MKLHAGVTSLLWAGRALAGAVVTNNAQGEVDSIIFIDDSPVNLFPCLSNKCLTALKTDPDAASTFCSSLATSESIVVTSTNPFPDCDDTKIAKAACACLVPTYTKSSMSSPTPTPTCLAPGMGPCTVANFIAVCCPDPNGSYGCLLNGNPTGTCFFPSG